MATKIRLQRHGKKRAPFYHIVIADARAKRDGKFIEKVGTYNPNTNPATIELNFDKALEWVGTGAQPTDTVRTLLSEKGVMYKNHLNKGVVKGALTQDQADKKFEAWMTEKETKNTSVSSKLAADEQAILDAKMAAEKAISDARAKVIAEKNAPEVMVEEAAAEAEAPAAEEAPVTEETPAEEAPEAAAPEATEE
jgi:small subunit ribosomal protein S16